LGIGRSSTVADIGCGSGIFAQFVLDRFPDAPDLRIVAVEPSESLNYRFFE
jgi:trans-aconitate methyltransferase